MAQSSAFAIVQDRRGFVWIGTQDGLHRTDGYRFTVYKPRPFEAGSLAHAMVQSLTEGRDGRLWVGTFRGLDRLDPSTGLFEPMLPGETPHVTALAEAADGTLWAGTLGEGLRRLDPDGEVVTYRTGDGLPSDHVWALAIDHQHSLWVGTTGGLARLELDGERFDVFRHDPSRPSSLPADSVLSLLATGSGVLWVGTTGGLALALPEPQAVDAEPSPSTTEDLAFESFRHDPDDPDSLASNGVRALLEDRQGTLWVGTVDGGLDSLRPGEGRFRHHRHDPGDLASLSDDGVWTLTEDRGGLLWVGTALGGVDVIDTRTKFRLERLSEGPAKDRVVRTMVEDAAGDLWVGLDGDGLLRRPVGEDTLGPVPGLDTGRVWHLHEDRRHRLWVGTEQGLLRLDATRRFTRTYRNVPDDPPAGPGAGGVRRVLETSEGEVWLGTFGAGLSRFDGDDGPFEHFRHDAEDPSSPSSDLIFSLIEDALGTLWVGTGEGLDRHLGEGRFRRHRRDPADRTSLRGTMVRSLYADAAGLWVGTDAGLSLMRDVDSGRFVHYTEADGLPNDTIYAIVSDSSGKLWISTNRGLSRFDPVSERFTNYDPSDGLQGWEFNGGAAFRGRDGSLYFGGVRGLNIFHPDDVVPNPNVPPVVFTGLRKLGQPVALERPLDEIGTLVLDWRDTVVTFEFAALDFGDPASNRYAYRLEGFDDDWIDIGSRNEATFTNLEPGRYRLRVRGSNADGVWNETGAALGVRVRPAPWRSPWAIALYVLGFCLVAGAIAWQAWRRQVLRREIAEVVATSERRLDLALVGSGDGLWDWDLVSGEVFLSHIAEMLGFEGDDLPQGGDLRQRLIHPDDLQDVEAKIKAHLAGQTPRYEAEYRMRHKEGGWRWILDRGVVVEKDDEGRPLRITGTLKDLTERKAAESELELWYFMFDSVSEGVFITDTHNIIEAVNTAFCKMTGFEPEDVLGQSTEVLESPYYDPEFYAQIRTALREEGHWQGEVRNLTKSGGSFLARVDLNQVVDPAGEVSNFVGVFTDVTESKKAEEELRFLASFDVLTGLPNRAHFQKALDAALEDARRQGTEVALIFGDLDRFKDVNDSLGHAVGDQLLKETARRLLAAVRKGDLVARLGGDEFTVLLGSVRGEEDIERVARRILDAFAAPFRLGGTTREISTSLGIGRFPLDADDAEGLIRQADTAMYEAKASGRNRYCFYSSDTDTHPRR